MRLERLKKALATPSFPAVLTNFCETDGWLVKTLRTANSLNQLTLPSAMNSIIKLTLPSLLWEHLGFVTSFSLSVRLFKGKLFQQPLSFFFLQNFLFSLQIPIANSVIELSLNNWSLLHCKQMICASPYLDVK